ncbi:threonine synthase [Dyella sp.]|uniref:threonine synthase n=1 Tax=Dyella sp. TaxID=1869338 RepID=UPI002ED46E91
MHERLLFHSTRGTASATLEQSISAGLAPDGGLYVPEALPRLPPDAFDGAHTLAEVAERLLAPFFTGSTLESALPSICAQALNFDTPLRPLASHANAMMLELFHGPTAAFKDVGARFLAACLARQPRADGGRLTILVATSGDTGAAVAGALHRQDGVDVVILYPDGRVSPRQAHQLGCFGDNVQALRVDGSFDDCQRMAKAMLTDPDVQARRPLSSANSISLGRLLPQMSYYAHAALKIWRESGMEASFIIPTGNLGNALACVWAREIGLPIGHIHLACNANDTLPAFFSGAAYTPQPTVQTLANAMDVGAPSNFERLRWTYPDETELRGELTASSTNDLGIRQTIVRHAREHGEVFCPHTATAMQALDSLPDDGRMRVVVATAHPAKFETVLEPLLGFSPDVPGPLAAMLHRSASAQAMPADESAFKAWLLEETPRAMA